MREANGRLRLGCCGRVSCWLPSTLECCGRLGWCGQVKRRPVWDAVAGSWVASFDLFRTCGQFPAGFMRLPLWDAVHPSLMSSFMPLGCCGRVFGWLPFMCIQCLHLSFALGCCGRVSSWFPSILHLSLSVGRCRAIRLSLPCRLALVSHHVSATLGCCEVLTHEMMRSAEVG